MVDGNFISNDFKQAIDTKQYIDVDKNGNWYRVNWFMRVVYQIFCCFNDERVARIVAAFNKSLDKIEQTEVKLNPLKNVTVGPKQDIDFKMIQAAGRTLANYRRGICVEHTKKKFDALDQRLVALDYRLEGQNGGKDKSLTQTIPLALEKAALDWKAQKPLLEDNKILTDQDKTILQGLVRYKGFADLMLKPENHELRERVFKWTLRDHLEGDVLVEFPGRADRIHECHMQHGLGYFNEKMLQVGKENGRKQPQIRMNDRFVSILDETKVVDFGVNDTAPIHKVFKQMQEKPHLYGDHDFSRKGLIKHSAVNLEECIDLSPAHKGDWWEQPKALDHLCRRVLTLDQTKARYGNECDGKTWGGRIMATREVMDLEAKGTHAYVEVGIPDRDGNYRVFTFAKSADVLPNGPLQMATAVAKTFNGKIISEGSIFHPLRQHRGLPFTMNHGDGLKFMDWIRDSITEGANNNMAYQLFTLNCAEWALQSNKIVGVKKIPDDIFRIHFFKSVPPGALKYVFMGVVKLAYWIQNIFFSMFFGALGAATSKVVVDKQGNRHVISLALLKPWTYPKNEKFNIPAVLFQNQDKGYLKCSTGKP